MTARASMRTLGAALLAASLVAAGAQAQQPTSTGSMGCSMLAQQAANGLSARMQADNSTIPPPTSVTKLTCLDKFFNGAGLNVVTNLLSPGNLLNAVEGQLCSALQTEWTSFTSNLCGLTVTGFNLGFGGLGGGLSCPKLSFGGGGPPIGSIGVGASHSGGGLYINGHALNPTGYPPSTKPQGTF